MTRPPPLAREAQETYAILRTLHPDAHCELDHRGAFELLVATVLAAQSTDKAVNQLTPALFARWPDATALAAAPPAEVEEIVSRIGMFRQKTKNIVGLAKLLVERHGGEVPRTLAELVELPGVGRKTANVVLGVSFGAAEGVVVDTHVQRVSQRLGWTKETEPGPIERDLMRLFPREDWEMLSHTVVFHGRRACFAQRPLCATCGVRHRCPSAGKAEHVGRKPPRARRRAPGDAATISNGTKGTAAARGKDAPATRASAKESAAARGKDAPATRASAKESAAARGKDAPATRASAKGTAATRGKDAPATRASAKGAAAARGKDAPATRASAKGAAAARGKDAPATRASAKGATAATKARS